MSFVRRIAVLALIVAVAAALLSGGMFNLFRNPTTPPGYVGYVTRGALVGQARFYDLQTGPTSSGLGWLLDVVNVSVTPYTNSEEFAGESSVLAADSLKIAFRVHVVWRVIPDRVREFIERYSTLRPGNSLTVSSRSLTPISSANRFALTPGTKCRNTRGSTSRTI